MTLTRKQKPNLAVRLADDMEAYLRSQANSAHRTLSAEVRMRLERTRQQDQQPTTKDKQ